MRSLHLGALLLAITATACGGGEAVTTDDDDNDASAATGTGAGTTGAGAMTGTGGDPTTTGTGGDPTTTGTGGDPTTTGAGGMGGDPTTTSSSSTTSTTSGSGGSMATCGNGLVESGEGCDDANLTPNDGCSDLCVTELGFSCNGAPSICTTICGDGVVVGPEGCDDNNSDPGDGCSSACLQENGYLCDGAPSVCNLTPTAAGHLVITEIMKNPGPTITDSNGEWFEIYNPTGTPFDLMGIEIADQGSDSHVIAAHVIVPAAGYAVLGRNGNTATNGGLNTDYVYSGITLTNGTDEVELYQGNTLIDAVAYTDAAFPDSEGVALSLTNGANATANDSGGNWCGASSAYGTASMMGTPGSANAVCNTGPTPPPSGWTCNAAYYDANDGCDCGCGVADPDCANSASSSCQWCDNSGSCSNVTGCGDISATNNAVCVPPPPPAGWTCNANFYGANDGCDCGCGVTDPDCADNNASSCQWCDNSGSCSSVTGCGDITATNNATCGPPGTWTCNATFYNNNDGCDCGCGATDPDCADQSAGSCQWCDNAGSCSSVSGCGDIAPNDNATCGAPATWTCNPAFYNANDGCDCGCGELDPDCADPFIGSCNWCDNAGSCSILPGCYDINPLFNADCL